MVASTAHERSSRRWWPTGMDASCSSPARARSSADLAAPTSRRRRWAWSVWHGVSPPSSRRTTSGSTWSRRAAATPGAPIPSGTRDGRRAGRAFRWVVKERWMKSRPRACSSSATTGASSPARRFTSTAASLTIDRLGHGLEDVAHAAGLAGHDMKIKQWFLILSSATIVVIGSLYGVSPQWFAKTFLGISRLDLDLAHILRAMMFLYLAFALFWLFAAFSDKYRNPAVLTVMLFPAGLVIGRILSVFVDGPPSLLLLVYLVAELIQAPVAYWVFRLPD